MIWKKHLQMSQYFDCGDYFPTVEFILAVATVVVVHFNSRHYHSFNFNGKNLENLVLFSLYLSCRCETRCGILKGSWQSWHTPPPLAVCSKVLPLTACGSMYDV